MSDLLFLAVCIAVVFLLAMRRAPLWLWAVSAGLALLSWQWGPLFGPEGEVDLGLGSLIAWVPVLARRCRHTRLWLCQRQ